jgi:hypothetical protein
MDYVVNQSVTTHGLNAWIFEASCSSMDLQNPSTDEPTLTVDDYMDLDNTMVEYNLNDMFSDHL